MPVSRSSIPDLQRPGLAGIEGERQSPPLDQPRMTDRAKQVMETLRKREADGSK